MTRAGNSFRDAILLLKKSEASDALLIAESLIDSGNESTRLDGYVCRGMIYEDGGQDIEIDLPASLDSYRRASLIAPGSMTFLHLARVLLKMGDPAAAYRYLEASSSYGTTPELLLGFATYHEEHVPMHSEEAKLFYRRVALRGLFSGFFGYARVSRKNGQNGRAFAMDCMRIILGPFIALVLGARARYQF